MRDILRDASGDRLGWIDRGKDEDVGRNAAGHVVGRFIHRVNQTRDATGHVIGYGDFLARLVLD